MQAALVQCVLHSQLWQVQSVRLVRVVGVTSDQRWLTLAEWRAGETQVRRDAFWFDVSPLPKLADYPLRERVLVTEAWAQQAAPVAGWTACFPVETQASVGSVLELQAEQPLSDAAAQLIDSLALVFANLQGLLDYGERDTLTELLNRKTFDAAFLRAAHASVPTLPPGQERRNTPEDAGYWLAVLDIDFFKRVNDTCGHLIGDEVLLLVARLMRTNFRFHDQLYRFGGEEFVVLMRCASHDDAWRALERFRLAVQAHDFPQVGRITISIGLAPLNANDTPGGAFDRADKAVYFAKEHGRNQVCSYTRLVQAGDLVEAGAPTDELDFF